MAQTTEAPSVRPGGLVTIAFLKARLDAGSDHLGMFMPLVFDVISQMSVQNFATADVQEALAVSHGVVMPQQTVATLLSRATKNRYLLREAGRYTRNPARDLPFSDVAVQKANIEEDQRRLGEALRSYASQRGFTIESPDTALDIILRFLETEQVVLLLGDPQPTVSSDSSHRERVLVAEFLQSLIQNDPALLAVIRGMLEGLVLYHAAFLPDLSAAGRRFKNLRVIFDSSLVREALGYMGTAQRTLMREAIDVLKASGVQCLVFDKTVYEIKGILALYEKKLGTTEGRASLRPMPMTRHFLTQGYSTSDVREMSALLEREIHAAGFQIQPAPSRTREYTAGEEALAARLSRPGATEDLEPRVIHDVDCVAGILTMRSGIRSSSIEEARAVFATDSPLVIRNARLWWEVDEHETGIEPVVHIRALANLAWLKKPSISVDFKVRELIALCKAALRPDQATWDCFLKHLNSLRKSQRITSDEEASILVSAMSDRLLRDAEFEEEGDIDAVTLDEIVDRVKASYAADAQQTIQTITEDYASKQAQLEAREKAATERADAAERTAAEANRRRMMTVEGRARTWARNVTRILKGIAVLLLISGALVLIAEHPFHSKISFVLGLVVAVFVIVECLGNLTHVSAWCAIIEARLTTHFRRWLDSDAGDPEVEAGDLTIFSIRR